MPRVCFPVFLTSKWLLQPVQFVGTKSSRELAHLMEPRRHSDPSLAVGSFFRELRLIVVSCTLMFVWDRRRPFRADNFMSGLFILGTLCKIWCCMWSLVVHKSSSPAFGEVWCHFTAWVAAVLKCWALKVRPAKAWNIWRFLTIFLQLLLGYTEMEVLNKTTRLYKLLLSSTLLDLWLPVVISESLCNVC